MKKRKNQEENTMYVITGATSRTGSVVANYLLEKGQSVRVLGRNAERLATFAKKGADIFVTESTDRVALTKAFTGAKAVYVMLQPNYITTSNDFRAFQERIIDAMIPALIEAKVQYVVSLSSWGADKSDGTGSVAGLHQLEQRLNDITNLNVLHLRPGYFMENTLSQVDNILARNTTAGPFKSDVKFPFIATRDVGSAAGEALLKLDFKGKQFRELHGNQDLTMQEVSTIIGKAIESPGLTYVQDSKEKTRLEFLKIDFSEHIIQLILEVADAMNAGHIRMLEPRSVENTTTTSYVSFVNETLLPLYRQRKSNNKYN
jgi:uncharacterized protein YbjT (DUF2867 family)